MSPMAHGCGGQTSVVIGGLPINIQSANRDFIAMLERRYAGFVAEPANGGIRLDVEVVAAVVTVTAPTKTWKYATRMGAGRSTGATFARNGTL